jgi:hypothetical protein
MHHTESTEIAVFRAERAVDDRDFFNQFRTQRLECA